MAEQHQVWRAYFDMYLNEAIRGPASVGAGEVVAQARAFADGVVRELAKHGQSPACPDGKSLGQRGYEAYGDAARPGTANDWSELSPTEQGRWEAAAEAIRAA